jgi:hypothetical protein
MDNIHIFQIILIQGSGDFLPFFGRKRDFFMDQSEVSYV